MAQKLLTQDIQVLLHLSAVADVFPAAPFNGSNSTLFIPLHQPFQQVNLKVQGICTCTWKQRQKLLPRKTLSVHTQAYYFCVMQTWHEAI